MPDEGALIAFAVHLTQAKHASPTVIRRQLRGAGQWFQERFGSDPRFDPLGGMRPQLDNVLKGIARTRSKRKKRRDPITSDRLRTFTDNIGALRLTSTDEAMVTAAMWLGMMGLLRAGEMTTKTQAGFDPAVNANRRDVTIHRSTGGRLAHLTFLLRQSKCDQTGRGVVVTMYASGTEHCAVRYMARYLDLTSGRPADGPLFQFQASAATKPLTRHKLNSFLQSLAKASGSQPQYTTTHSLRQGGAVTLFALGYTADFIKKAGRWLSGAYEVYLSIPDRDRESMARKMATAQLGGDAAPEESQASWSSLYSAISD